MRDVAFRYPATGFGLALRELTVEAGGRVFLRGPSGSGKTTLLRLATGLLVPDGGRVQLGEHEMTGRSGPARDRLRADAIGTIHQIFNLLPHVDVVGNVTLPLAFARHRRARVADADGEARALLSRLGVPERLHDARAASLSVGQQQRVAIARALIGRPPLVIADEPTSALDEDARDVFLDLLFGLADETGAALLMVSHDRAVGERFAHRLDLRDIATVTH